MDDMFPVQALSNPDGAMVEVLLDSSPQEVFSLSYVLDLPHLLYLPLPFLDL
jgi:hypothetical protein